MSFFLTTSTHVSTFFSTSAHNTCLLTICSFCFGFFFLSFCFKTRNFESPVSFTTKLINEKKSGPSLPNDNWIFFFINFWRHHNLQKMISAKSLHFVTKKNATFVTKKCGENVMFEENVWFLTFCCSWVKLFFVGFGLFLKSYRTDLVTPNS